MVTTLLCACSRYSWSEEEDARLLEAVAKFGEKNWKAGELLHVRTCTCSLFVSFKVVCFFPNVFLAKSEKFDFGLKKQYQAIEHLKGSRMAQISAL